VESDARGVGEAEAPAFAALCDLASSRLGGRALQANDEFFAAKGNLLKPGRAVFIPGKYTSRGKWMDGWETRRRRTPGHDWCVIQLGAPGRIHGVEVDTSHFVGNFPAEASLDAARVPPGAGRAGLARAAWRTIVPVVRLQGDQRSFFGADPSEAFTHVRLNIFPDGGVARLRVYGEVDAAGALAGRRRVDLAALRHGGLVLGASDMHFGSKDNLIMPGRAKDMSDGWETRRRRGPGHDWLILRLAAPGTIETIEVDTNHFKGNYPESCSLEGALAPGASLAQLLRHEAWAELLSRTRLSPHKRHLYRARAVPGPLTHVRFRIFPDGGVSRLRLHGRPSAA
jgi:allantoicase